MHTHHAYIYIYIYIYDFCITTGTMTFGTFCDEAESHAIINCYVKELGGNFLDGILKAVCMCSLLQYAYALVHPYTYINTHMCA